MVSRLRTAVAIHFLAGLMAFCHAAHEADTALITSMAYLRGTLLNRIRKSRLPNCAFALTGRRLADIPFRIVIGTGTTDGMPPDARRNAGHQIIDHLRIEWSDEYDEEGETIVSLPVPITGRIANLVEVDGARIEAGFEFYFMPPSTNSPLREHLLLLKTFPNERLAGRLIYALARELRLRVHQDILVLNPDIDWAVSNPPELEWHVKSSGNLGVASIAHALGMPVIPKKENPSLLPHHPFHTLRFGIGRPEKNVDRDKRPKELAAYLDEPVDSNTIANYSKVPDLVQQWLVLGYYSNYLPPSVDKNGNVDTKERYFGKHGRHESALR